MAKKLSSMTTADMKKEMSIAGSPDKIIGLMTDINTLIFKSIDINNAAELINIKFVLQRLISEIKLCARQLEKRTGQKYNV